MAEQTKIWFHNICVASPRGQRFFCQRPMVMSVDRGASQMAGRRYPSLRVFSPLSTNDWRWFLLQLLLDWKSPTLAPLARCGSGCSRSVKRLVERKFSPTSSGGQGEEEVSSSTEADGAVAVAALTGRENRRLWTALARRGSSQSQFASRWLLCSTDTRPDCHDDGFCVG